MSSMSSPLAPPLHTSRVSPSEIQIIVTALKNLSRFPLKSPNFPANFPPNLDLCSVPRIGSCSPRTIRQSCCADSNSGSTIGGEGLEIAEAREAVSEILRKSGVSEEESLEIALNSPVYVSMLVESVRDLDEHSLWDSWRVEGEEASEFSFREKVFCVAKEKGDGGMLAFLESVGLNPSSSTHVARYLASEPIPELIEKVKFVKEMLFPISGNGGTASKNARRMMNQLSISVDDDVQQTLSFFEKMEARRGGLTMLDSGDDCFQYLVESFPRLLSLSLESQLKPLVEYLESVGVSKACIRVVLLLFPPIMFQGVEKDIKPKLLALAKAGVAEKDIGRMLVKYPWILSASILENYDRIISFFELEKLPKGSVDRAIRSWPHLLGCSTSRMKMMVEQFGEFGVKNKRLGKVIASSPQLLIRKTHEVIQVVSFLEELGFDKEGIGKIISRCPEIFAASIENTLKKKLKFLADIGITEDNLPRVIRKYPELFVSDIDRTLYPRMEFLMEAGLSKKQIASMVHRFSPLVGYSIDEVLKPKLEFLLNTMEKPLKDVVEYPRYFSYSLDKKIKPRFWVLKNRNMDCSLKDMLGKNDEEFAAEYMGIGRMLVPPPSLPTLH
ncbi:hypothetical protein Scep_023132 [Stephania cephalantha]|uniref:Uncharacterized protein n=1 Tax=Stephania cephalantha TaxID=152367 RepID=A0AAP0HW14_9MAGN